MPEEDGGELHVTGRPGWTGGRARGTPPKSGLGGRRKGSVPPQSRSPINSRLFSQQEPAFGPRDGLTGAGTVASPARFCTGQGLTAPGTCEEPEATRPTSGRERNVGQKFL